MLSSLSANRSVRCLAATTLLATFLIAGCGDSAVDGPNPIDTTSVPADPYSQERGIERFEVHSQGDQLHIRIVGTPEVNGEVVVRGQGPGQVTTLTLQDGSVVTALATDHLNGVVTRDGVEIGRWAPDASGEIVYENVGEHFHGDSFGLLLDVLSDDELSAAYLGAGVGKAIWPVLLPLGPVYLIWCISQCQCCENHYLGNPAPGTPEPSCCGNCFSPRCGDIL